MILKVRPAVRGIEKEWKKERKKERRSSLEKRNEAGTNASISIKERGRNGQCFGLMFLSTTFDANTSIKMYNDI